jgi:prepilin-type N-terminal cleavage/methylation domain-containing protein
VSNKGFSIIELLIVTAIISTFSVVLILNFRSSPTSKLARNQVAAVVVSDIRQAQSLTLAGSRFQDNLVCGYGIHYLTNVSYLIYAGLLNGATKCQDINHNYESGIDVTVETRTLINSKMEMRSSFSDIFFESPDPKTYINNNSALDGPPTTISIQLVGQQNCGGQSCTQITVYPSGRINTAN